MEVKVLVLVTDKGARALRAYRDGEDQDERESDGDALKDAFRWEGATTAELRVVSFEVPLLAAVEPSRVTVEVAPVEMAPDVRRELEERAKARRRANLDELIDLLTDALSPGTYEITRSPNSRGIRRIT